MPFRESKIREPAEVKIEEVTEEAKTDVENTGDVEIEVNEDRDNEVVETEKIIEEEKDIVGIQEQTDNLNIPEYELEQGVEKLIKEIKEKIHQTDEVIIVEIAGGSSTGKTKKVAEQVAENVKLKQNTLLFSMDNYYKGGKYVKENGLNLDQPEAIDIDLFLEHLQCLKNNKSIPKLKYNFDNDPPEIIGELQPQKVVIVEGLFAINNQLKKLGDIKVFVDTGFHGRIIRRLLRDVKERDEKPDDILKYFSEIVEPMHEKHIKDTKNNADFIINNEYNPKKEAERCEMYELQMKFKKSINEEYLRKIGVIKLNSLKQIDYYYNPKDRNLTKTGEILRIREQAEDIILTYKGPKVESSKFRKRPKFEFQINEEIKSKFLPFYGDEIKVIKKNRTFYQLDGVEFSFDLVSKIENHNIIDLGNFIEIRTTDIEMKDKKMKEKIKKVMLKLGLKIEQGTKKAYVEM